LSAWIAVGVGRPAIFGGHQIDVVHRDADAFFGKEHPQCARVRAERIVDFHAGFLLESEICPNKISWSGKRRADALPRPARTSMPKTSKRTSIRKAPVSKRLYPRLSRVLSTPPHDAAAGRTADVAPRARPARGHIRGI